MTVTGTPPTSADAVEPPPATLPLPNWLAYAIAAVDVCTALILPFALSAGGQSLGDAVADFELQNVAVATALGALILHRRPGHVIGWVLVLAGVFDALAGLSKDYQLFGLPAGSEIGTMFAWCWAPAAAGILIVLPQLFPDGHLLSPRWRPLVYLGGVATVLMAIASVIAPAGAEQPLLADVAYPLFGLAILGSMVPLAVRFHRSRGLARQPFKWVFYGFAISVVTFAPTVATGVDGARQLAVLTLIPVVAIPATVTVAVLRYRLYDVDLVINKTLVFAVLAGFITAVYAAIVVGLGRLLPIGQGGLGLSIVATALVAVAFEPVRVRVQHWVNRLVYGRRATPYEALAAMTATLGDTADPGAALAEAARLLADGTGAAQAVVWVRQAGRLDPRATAGTGALAKPEPIPLRGAELPEMAGADLAQAVRHDGRLVGALTLTKRGGEGLSTADRRLVEGLAGQAALLLANTRLRSRLNDRLDELRASRRRMLAAQDRARRGLERDLHDGAQQELVALKIKLGLARTIATREGATDLAARLADTSTIADKAVDTLREVARGIYPPLLESDGLAAALTAQTRRTDIAVTVLHRDTARYRRDLEATAYFCAVEAVQNAARHANAEHAHIELDGTEETLTITITDDGDGSDPDANLQSAALAHLTDRADAAGGTLTIACRAGHGTTVTLTLPAAAQAVNVANAQASCRTNGSNSDLVMKSNAPASIARAR